MATSFKRFIVVIGILFGVVALTACGSVQERDDTLQVSSSTGPTPVVVRILNLDNVMTVTPSPATSTVPATSTLAQSSPTPAAAQVVNQPSQSAPQATSTPSCTNQAEFVAHLSVSPNTVLKAGQLLGKVWQIRNVGECTWDETYSLVFVDGERMEAPEVTPLGATVKPGETVDLRINIIAPIFPGPYTGNWLLRDGQGNRFGLSPDHSQPLQIVIVVSPQPAPTTSCWQCQKNDEQ